MFGHPGAFRDPDAFAAGILDVSLMVIHAGLSPDIST
jgi:hypothetical protein